MRQVRLHPPPLTPLSPCLPARSDNREQDADARPAMFTVLVVEGSL